nr:TIM-barrel domain-containing protein [Nakamurella panacisegetis]
MSVLAGAVMAIPAQAAQASAAPAAAVTTAATGAIVSGSARFEVLSPTLIRTEYAGDTKFVDDATFNAIGRDSFTATTPVVSTVDGWLTIKTSAVTLAYKVDSGPFTADNLRLTEANGTQAVTAAPWASITAPTCAFGTLCEAEDLALNGLTLATDHSGYTGHGFVGGFANVGDSLSFTVNVPAAGEYDVDARYANSTGGDGKNVTRTLSVSADGGAASTLSLPTTANWDSWNVAKTTLTLSAGAHTITFTHTATDSGNVNFDSVAAVTTGDPYPGVAAPVAAPCDFGSICELDSGTLAGGAKLAFDHNNYSGTGFVAGMETTTATDMLTVTGVPPAGHYQLQLRYANNVAGAKGIKSRRISITVGSAAATTATLAPTSSWDAWRTVAIPVDLIAGDNVVTLGCPDADGCNVNLDTAAFTTTSSALLDPHAPLGGYRRSLDGVDGGALTNPGLLYQDGWSLIDDTASGIFNTSTRALTPRPTHGGTPYQDGYVFGYGKDYAQGLQDLATLTGPPKLLPRWAYGVWYSEYYDRTAADYQNTILPKFRSEGVPLDVLVTDTDFKSPNQWNGWEIDTSKFPDPAAYFAWAHAQGLHTSLNIHPSILASDPQFAQAQATAKGKLQPGSCSGGGANCYVFDFGDPDQLQAYLDLHNTMQADGNDLWWLDWCCDSTTSSQTGISGDALINQAYADYTAKTVDRGFAFSRAYGSLATGGYGNSATSSTGPWADKRTTLHFTGDTISDWSTLAYEVGYTPGESSATGMASISHDIGGHTGGAQTTGSEPNSTKLADDLYARWVQLGTFQPIDRLHSNHSDRLPWQYGAAAESSADKFLNLREKLVPYTYSLAQQSSTTGMPIVRDLYLQYPDQQEAYANDDSEYLYGPDVLVAPVTTPGTGSVTTNVWFPAGSTWTDYFTGKTYAGGTTAAVTTDLSTMPVFIKSGGIMTTRTDNVANDVQNALTKVTVTVAGGANGAYSLYEDNGTTTDTTQSATTAISYTEKAGVSTLNIAAAKGSYAGQVTDRQWTAQFTNADAPKSVSVNGIKLAATAWKYDAATRTVTVTLAPRKANVATTISYKTHNNPPKVAPTTVTTHAGKAIRIAVKATDADGDALTYSYSRPAHGTVSGSGANIVYTPTGKFVGTDSFRVTVTDTSRATATAAITVKVVNRAPTASAITKKTKVATPVSITLKGADADRDPLTYTHTKPAHGTVTGSGASLRYAPSRTFSGVDHFNYTVSDPFGGKVTRTVRIDVSKVTPAVAVTISPHTITTKTPAVITVRARVPNGVSAGTAIVTVKVGRKTLARGHLTAGTVKLALPRLGKGRYSLAVSVAPSRVTLAVTKKVIITVT